MSTDNVRGRFMWYDLMTTDSPAAQEFYTKAMGWTLTNFDAGGTPYPMWTNQGTPMGGVMVLPEQARKMGAPPHWLMYVGTEDVDATNRLATELGARTYVAPQDIPTVGRFAVLADPQGATFALFKPLKAPETPEAPPKVGEFSWRELATTDHGAALAFYNKLFGWDQLEAHEMGPIGTYRIFGRGTTRQGGIFNKPPDMAAPPHWLFYVSVSDINDAVARVKANRGMVLNGPMQVPGGHWIAQCSDPQGAAFALHQVAA